MPRRTATLITATLTLVALLCAGLFLPSPYGEMSPGPTWNTLGDADGRPVLEIKGHKSYDTTGHLNMTTVRVTGPREKRNLVEAVYGWLHPEIGVVPYKTLYPDPDKSAEEVDEQNAEEFTRSQDSAKAAALDALDIPYKSRVVVGVVIKDSPSEGKLHAGDVIKAVDGSPVKKPGDVADLVTKHQPGEETVFTVIPAKEAKAAEKAKREPRGGEDVTLTTRGAPEDNRAIVGIQAGVAHTFPFKINISLHDVGGPSAGLMFALGIVDKLEKTDLTGGAFVAGTGTIDAESKVGPIGGIQMKTIGARAEGAEYFLTPKDNCATAAQDIPDGLTLVEVDTMDDAMAALKDIREDNPEGLKTCKG